LQLCKSMIKKNGGKFRIESELGKGQKWLYLCLKPKKMDNVNVLIIEDTAESDALSKVLLANSYNLVGIAHFQRSVTFMPIKWMLSS
jgi:hypothetical protein